MDEDEILKQLQAELDKQMRAQNSTPVEAIDNLSPNDMHNILYFTFEEQSPIGFRKEIKSEALEKIPFLNLVVEYLKRIEEVGELKLTKLGNLPRKLVLDLYDLGIIKEEFLENGITKLSKEQDTKAIQNSKILCLLSGITKQQKNKMSLTALGKKLLKNNSNQELLEILFKVNYQQFNWAYYDGYPENVGIQKTFGYTIYLLLRYGKDLKNLSFYTKKNLVAFPNILENFEEESRSPETRYNSCYAIRILNRFLAFYGFVDYREKNENYLEPGENELKTTDLFHQVFELRKEKFNVIKSSFKA